MRAETAAPPTEPIAAATVLPVRQTRKATKPAPKAAQPAPLAMKSKMQVTDDLVRYKNEMKRRQQLEAAAKAAEEQARIDALPQEEKEALLREQEAKKARMATIDADKAKREAKKPKPLVRLHTHLLSCHPHQRRTRGHLRACILSVRLHVRLCALQGRSVP